MECVMGDDSGHCILKKTKHEDACIREKQLELFIRVMNIEQKQDIWLAVAESLFWEDEQTLISVDQCIGKGFLITDDPCRTLKAQRLSHLDPDAASSKSLRSSYGPDAAKQT
ncbi:hypothetical protein Q8A67_021050 [Cirrhinus molitorella]|uniref:Uncharacterized protein n=1 Tax=Cirrhinus molitorella TaxID=172907 RepID=A0AA88P6A6_9TELE|nr:hypothetical protein Q8A67_021050 [Cirrhinus molitorella]